MADDSLSQLLATAGSVAGGGGISALVMRLLFTGMTKRLDSIEKTLQQLVDKSDARHEKLIERLAAVEGKADAAHRRLDELKRGRR